MGSRPASPPRCSNRAATCSSVSSPRRSSARWATPRRGRRRASSSTRRSNGLDQRRQPAQPAAAARAGRAGRRRGRARSLRLDLPDPRRDAPEEEGRAALEDLLGEVVDGLIEEFTPAPANGSCARRWSRPSTTSRAPSPPATGPTGNRGQARHTCDVPVPDFLFPISGATASARSCRARTRRRRSRPTRTLRCRSGVRERGALRAGRSAGAATPRRRSRKLAGCRRWRCCRRAGMGPGRSAVVLQGTDRSEGVEIRVAAEADDEVADARSAGEEIHAVRTDRAGAVVVDRRSRRVVPGDQGIADVEGARAAVHAAARAAGLVRVGIGLVEHDGRVVDVGDGARALGKDAAAVGVGAIAADRAVPHNEAAVVAGDSPAERAAKLPEMVDRSRKTVVKSAASRPRVAQSGVPGQLGLGDRQDPPFW